MLDLLIVDDEVEFIEGIKLVIDWEDYDISICGDANNGASALELIKKLSPQIALIDIQMPIMDGLQLLDEIHKNNLNTKCIILSGYDDFYYAQKAINLKASDYLLKPCRPEDILESVLRVKKTIEEEKLRDNLLDKYKKHFYENIPVLKEKLLREIIYGKACNYANLMDKMSLYDIKINISNIVVAILHIDIPSEEEDQVNELDMEYIKIAAIDLASNTMPKEFITEIFQNGDDIVAILSYEDEKALHTLSNKILPEVKTIITSNLQVLTTIGLGGIVKDINNIGKSFDEATAAVEAKFFMGEDSVIIFDEISMENSQNVSYPVKEDIEIINCLSTGNDNDLKSKIDNFFKSLNNGLGISKDYVQYSCFALLGSILRFCLEKNIDINIMFSNKLTWFNEIEKCETAHELQEKLLNIIKDIFNKVNEDKNINHLIKTAVEYIIENYSKDISLETVAKNIFITPGYLSLLFKQETGINFLEYLNKYRIEKAKEHLHNKFLKNYEVSRMVGYGNEKYFSQMFKRYTGMTPSQYKDSLF